MIVVALAVFGGGALLLLSGDDDADPVAQADSEGGNISTGGQHEPDFSELEKIQPPGLEDLDLDFDDFEPPGPGDDLDFDDLDLDLDDLDLGDSDDGSGGRPDVNVGPPDDPPTGEDSFQDFLADECFDGSMAACDLLFWEADFGSDHEAYGDTCGGRLDTSALPSCVDLLGEEA